MPLVSVVIPSYNAARYVRAAIDSVLQQSFTDFEVLVVDDGSTDDTRAVVSEYGHPVRYLHKPNGGVSTARNHGIAASTGRYVALLDADDTWFPPKLERQLEAMARAPGIRLSSTGYRFVDDELRPLRDARPQHFENSFEGPLLHGVVSSVSTLVAERTLFDEVGGFDPQLSQCADWDMWIRLGRRTQFLPVDDILATYRQHNTNMSRSVALLERDSRRVLEKAFSDPLTPEPVRRRANRTFGRNWMVLAGSYYHAGEYRDFMRCAVNALRLDPAQSARLLGYPFRVLSKIAHRAGAPTDDQPMPTIVTPEVR
jgi:glycosyltransferase involved in cell wall biosynthesis